MLNLTEAQERQDLKAEIATIILLISFAMLFATLFLSYGIYRGNTPTWPPMGFPRPSLNLPLTTLVICFISSLLLFFASKASSLNHFVMFRTFFSMSHVFAYLFAFSQWSLWSSLENQGLLVTTGGLYASILYGFTWIHAAHVLIALILLAYCQWAFIKGPDHVFEKRNIIRATVYFWHFLFFVWCLMFLFLFFI